MTGQSLKSRCNACLAVRIEESFWRKSVLWAATVCFSLCLLANEVAVGQEKTEQSEAVRLGGVAYAPQVVTIFTNLTRYLNGKGFKSSFVLYGRHEDLVKALGEGEVDVAWMAPVTHGLYHIRYGWNSQKLAMRDVDQGLRVTLLTRKDAGISSPKDLAGKRLIVGRTGSQEGSLLPLHYFRQEGVDSEKIRLVDLKGERDEQGRRADNNVHILQALSEGRGDAAVVLESYWNRSTAWQKANPDITPVWESPEFCHCTFTAASSFDKKTGSQFTNLITNMDRSDPIVAELLRLEYAQKFVPSKQTGFEALYQALDEREKK